VVDECGGGPSAVGSPSIDRDAEVAAIEDVRGVADTPPTSPARRSTLPTRVATTPVSAIATRRARLVPCGSS
jgi:hypothetical protein